MLGILFLVGLAAVLAALEILVRRMVGDHPHHTASPSDIQSVYDSPDIWVATRSSNAFGGGGD